MSKEAFRVEPLIRRFLDENPTVTDPMVITKAIVDAIPQNKLREALLRCAYDRTRNVIHQHRVALTDGESDELAARRTPTVGASRWKRHGRWPVEGGDWKLLEDLTAEDCEWNAQEYDKRAAANEAMATRFRELAQQVRALGLARVGDLPDLDTTTLPVAA